MKVSIITPSYNQAPFIERTMKSVLGQDWTPIEYVVFDGGSTDGTVDILQKYSDRVRWVSEPDKGQSDAINKGIRSTNGEIVGWLSSDDIYYPGAIRRIAEYFAAHPETDVVYGGADHIDIDDRPYESYPTQPWSSARMLKSCIICQPAAFVRRSVFDRYGLLDTDLHYCMDYEFWLRLGAAGARFDYLEQKLAGSRMYPQNKTLESRIEVHAEINDMFHRRFGRASYHWLKAYASVAVDERKKRARAEGKRSLSIVAPLEITVRLVLAAWRWNWSHSSQSSAGRKPVAGPARSQREAPE